MRRLPLNMRAAREGLANDEIEVGLIRVRHPESDLVVRLSTDPTERLSTVPLRYCTRSSWLTPDPAFDPYLFVTMSVLVPDDKDEAPASAQLVLDAVDETIGRALRSTTRQARVDMAIVMASDPNHVLAPWTDFRLLSAEGNDESITMSFSRDRMTTEPWPAHRMGRSYFPALFR